MIRQSIHDVSLFEISEPSELKSSRYGGGTFVRELRIENEDGEILEITLFTEINKETLLPKRMKE